MLKQSKTWIYLTAILMLLTGFFHSLSLFVKSEPVNETERQMLDLIANYKMDAGGGFYPTFGNLFTALSSCFSLLYLFGGILFIYFVCKNLETDLFKGVLNIAIFFFGICFLMMAFFTFLPPIICTCLVFVCLILSRFTLAK
jgi:hypothetical protein